MCGLGVETSMPYRALGMACVRMMCNLWLCEAKSVDTRNDIDGISHALIKSVGGDGGGSVDICTKVTEGVDNRD